MSQFHPAKTLIITIMTILVLTLYALLHVVVGIYLQHVSDLNFGWELWVLGVSSILCWITARWKKNIVTHIYYIMGAVWMGVVFISFLVFFPFILLNKYFEVGYYPNILVPLVLALVIAGLFLARVPKLVFITQRIQTLGKSKKPIRLVQITDLHIGEIYGPKYLKKIVDKVNGLEPDYVVITGDLFDGAGKLYSGMIDPINSLNAKHQVLFVTGNHEVYEGVAVTTKLIKQQGVRVLDDEIITLGGIQFIGLSYPDNFVDKKHAVLKRLAKKLDPTKPKILLRHEPRSLNDAAAANIDLQLSGHTHSGQLWPVSYMINLFYEYRVGLHKKGLTTIYISPGTATWGPPFRLGSRSEITVFDLVSR